MFVGAGCSVHQILLWEVKNENCREKKDNFSVGDSAVWQEGGEMQSDEYGQGPFRISEVIPVPEVSCNCGADEFFKSGKDPWPDEDILHHEGCPKNIGSLVGHHQWVKIMDVSGVPIGETHQYGQGNSTPAQLFRGFTSGRSNLGHTWSPAKSRGLFLF